MTISISLTLAFKKLLIMLFYPIKILIISFDTILSLIFVLASHGAYSKKTYHLPLIDEITD